MTWKAPKAISKESEPCPPLEFFIAKLHAKQPWRRDALCFGQSTKEFFPEKAAKGPSPIGLCLQCPVNTECLQDNLEEPWGIWGATTANDRRKILLRIEEGSPIPEISHGTARGYRQHFKYGDAPPCPSCVEAFERQTNASRVA